jgi:hypothetical protein
MSILATIAGMAPDQARLRSRIDLLTRQVSTGQVGQVHGDLGPQARRAIDLRGDIARREAHLVATDSALGRMAVAQETLGRLETLANDVATAAQRARTLGTIALEPLARSARAALEEAAALMNMRHGGDPLFAGSHLARDPVPDAASIATGPMAAAIGAAVATLGASNAGAVLAATAAAATDPATTPFDPWLETDGIAEQRRALLVADGERVAFLATRDGGTRFVAKNEVPIDLALEMHARGIRPADVRHIRIRVSGQAVNMVGRQYDPQTAGIVDAQFSIAYTVAVALERGAVLIGDFTETTIHEAKTGEFAARRITIEAKVGHQPLHQGGHRADHAAGGRKAGDQLVAV